MYFTQRSQSQTQSFASPLRTLCEEFPWIARIQIDRSFQLIQSAIPFALPAVHEADKPDRQRVVRLNLDRALKLRQRRLVLAKAIIVKQTQRDMCFGQIGCKCHGLFCQSACLRQLRFAQRVGQPMTPQLAHGQLRNGQGEIRVARNRFLVPAFSLVE
jgi:hypothetical protein